MVRLRRSRKLRGLISVFVTVVAIIGVITTGGYVENEALAIIENEPPLDMIFIEDLFEDEDFIAELDEMLIEEFGEEFLENIDQARENDTALMELFAETTFQELAIEIDELEETLEELADMVEEFANDDFMESSENVYPDFVGGIYYDDDGNMVLQIVEDFALENEEQFQQVEEFLAETDDIIVEFVEFSQNELTATMDALNAMFLAEDSPEAFNNVSAFGADCINNSIEVHLKDYSEAEIIHFRETILDSLVLVFIEVYDELHTETSVAPRITLNPGSSNRMWGGSVGYRARRNGRDGFVTHGHGGIRRNQNFVVNGFTYGTVVEQQFSGQIDASFVETNIRVNLTASPVSTTTAQTQFRTGDNVTLLGQTSLITHGTIRNTNYTWVCTARITGTVRANYSSAAGDSGGVVLWHNANTVRVAGIHIGRTTNILGIRNGAAFCRADRINAAFGLTMF
ncbi:MAG: S1 family peptidase [Oscillospiraceae bacterium]|nr:S1 family peptidase [Oscillospiraceae bacterium]